MDAKSLKKLRVAELRAKLEAAGLSCDGTKVGGATAAAPCALRHFHSLGIADCLRSLVPPRN